MKAASSMTTISADTLRDGATNGDTIRHGSAQRGRTSRHGVRNTIHNMQPTKADVAIFWLMLGALVAVNFDAQASDGVHGVTVGFTALGVLCAAAAAAMTPTQPERGLVDRCLALCVGSAAAQGACSHTTVAHRVMTTVASVAVVAWGGGRGNGNTIKVRHAATMTTQPP